MALCKGMSTSDSAEQISLQPKRLISGLLAAAAPWSVHLKCANIRIPVGLQISKGVHSKQSTFMWYCGACGALGITNDFCSKLEPSLGNPGVAYEVFSVRRSQHLESIGEEIAWFFGGRSLTKGRNKSGPEAEPCRTPLVISNWTYHLSPVVY